MATRRAGRGWLLALALLALAPTQASAAWQSLGNLSPASASVAGPDVAAAANGDQIAVWQRGDGFNDRAQIAVHHPGGAWGDYEDVSEPSVDISEPHVALDADGNATFAWRMFDGTNWLIETRTRSAAGELGSVHRLSGLGQDASDPRVAVDADGNAVFAWVRFDGANWRVQTRSVSNAGVLGGVANLSSAGQNGVSPDLAVAPGGDATIVWKRSNGTVVRVEARRRHPDGTVDPLMGISSTNGDADAPDVAAETDGTSAFTWTESNGVNTLVRMRVASPGGTLSPSMQLGPGGRDALEPQIAATGSGGSIVVWRRFDGTQWRINLQQFAADGSPDPDTIRQGLSHPGDAFEPRVAVSADDVALVAWRRFNGTHWTFETRERAADGALDSPRSWSAPDQDAFDLRVAMASNGEGVALWRPEGGASHFGLRAVNRSAGGTYTGPAELFSGLHAAREAQVAANADGEAVFAWRRLDVSGWILEARRRAPDGTLGPVVKLGDGQLDDAHLRVALDNDGNALFAWERVVPNNAYPGVLIRYWPAGGSLMPQQAIWSNARRPELAFDGAGNATIVGETFTDRGRIWMRTRSAGGTLAPTQTLSSTTEWAQEPRVAVAPDATTSFAWDSYLGPGDEPIRARTRSAGGTLSPIVTVSGTGITNEPALAIGANGTSLVAWERQVGDSRVVEGRRMDAAANLGAPRSVSDPGVFAFHPHVAVLPTGAGAFAWTASGTETPTRWVQTRVITTTQSLGSIVDISPTDGFTEGDVSMAATSDDRFVYAWSRFVASFHRQIETRTRGLAGSPTAIEGLSDPTRDATGPMVAADGLGNAFIVWQAFDGTTARVQGAVGSG